MNMENLKEKLNAARKFRRDIAAYESYNYYAKEIKEIAHRSLLLFLKLFFVSKRIDKIRCKFKRLEKEKIALEKTTAVYARRLDQITEAIRNNGKLA